MMMTMIDEGNDNGIDQKLTMMIKWWKYDNSDQDADVGGNKLIMIRILMFL